MSGILCALRGGASSLLTLEKAIPFAEERNLPVQFLFILDTAFPSREDFHPDGKILKEMLQLGKSIVLSAQRMARSRNVNSIGEVREGNVEEKILEVSKEVEADFVIIGHPEGEQGLDTFTNESLSKFVNRIENETNSNVILV